MSETPTDPNPTDTVNAATETGEKMIPLSAVAPLLMVANWMLREQSFPPELVSAYEIAKQATGDPAGPYVISGYAQLAAAARSSLVR